METGRQVSGFYLPDLAGYISMGHIPQYYYLYVSTNPESDHDLSIASISDTRSVLDPLVDHKTNAIMGGNSHLLIL